MGNDAKPDAFMAQQQMLVTLFLFPAIALAIYKNLEKREPCEVKSMLVTMVLTAMLGNVTNRLNLPSSLSHRYFI